MKSTIFAGRNIKEIVRDPVSIIMGLCFCICQPKIRSTAH